MYCKNCGNFVRLDDSYCSNCGMKQIHRSSFFKSLSFLFLVNFILLFLGSMVGMMKESSNVNGNNGFFLIAYLVVAFAMVDSLGIGFVFSLIYEHYNKKSVLILLLIASLISFVKVIYSYAAMLNTGVLFYLGLVGHLWLLIKIFTCFKKE